MVRSLTVSVIVQKGGAVPTARPNFLDLVELNNYSDLVLRHQTGYLKINCKANVMENLSYTLAVSFVISLGLLAFTNKSNVPTYLAVPFITAVLVKYLLGDWDEGMKWSQSDLQYFSAVIATSYATTMLISKNT